MRNLKKHFASLKQNVFYIFLIAKTAHRETVVLAVVVAVHVGVAVVDVAAVGVGTKVLGSTPEIGVVAEIVVDAVVAACRNSRKSCGIVARRSVANITIVRRMTPARGRSQRLGNVVFVVAANILALAAYIVGELRPLRIARYMPTIRTNALHSARIGRRRGGVAHHRLPIVQQTVCGFFGRFVIGIIPISNIIGIRTAPRNRGAVRILRGFQILFHPALSAYLHRGVTVAVVVLHCATTLLGRGA